MDINKETAGLEKIDWMEPVQKNTADVPRSTQNKWLRSSVGHEAIQRIDTSNKKHRRSEKKLGINKATAKRTRQKYQNMLTGEEQTGRQSTANLGVKAEPSESDLHTGCFTDVTYAGYFARQPSEHHQRLNDISICGNTSNLEEDQNKLCKQRGGGSVDQEARIDAGDEEHLVRAGAEITQKSENKTMPTPSPRLKKKQRREQFLQEHKQFGKNVLAIAKNNLDQDPVTSLSRLELDL